MTTLRVRALAISTCLTLIVVGMVTLSGNDHMRRAAAQQQPGGFVECVPKATPCLTCPQDNFQCEFTMFHPPWDWGMCDNTKPLPKRQCVWQPQACGFELTCQDPPAYTGFTCEGSDIICANAP